MAEPTPLTCGHCFDVQGGVWVLGMIKGAAADAAGVRQGDELLTIDGAPTAELSPFQAAGLLQGAGNDEPPPSVDLQVCQGAHCRLLLGLYRLYHMQRVSGAQRLQMLASPEAVRLSFCTPPVLT